MVRRDLSRPVLWPRYGHSRPRFQGDDVAAIGREFEASEPARTNDGHHVQRSKLIVDTIKWEVSKMLPKLYGDIITQELDITGDLGQLLEAASNRDNGLPPAD